ncbi:MAG: hypothetical protein GC165_02485 [Armatimonadetes bacterium]|nr:hypothetical protein [Armatimonadota bacterium]
MKRILISLPILALSMAALAVDVTGKYNGKLSIDATAMKKGMVSKAAKGTDAEKKQAQQIVTAIDQQVKAANASVLKLELKKGGTLTLVQTIAGKTETDSGKWTLKGDTITLSNLTSKGGGPKTITGKVSKDGKTLSFSLDEEMKKQGAAMGAPAPTGSLTFKKA